MKYQCVLQYSEEDCGAACIATIVKYYKRTFALNRIREAIGTGQLGTSLLGLRRGAEALGFNARQVRASPEIFNRLDELFLPAIIHWKGRHWVVLYGRQGKKYAIADPAVGIRYLNYGELTAGWANGVMLLLVPDEIRFYAQPEDTVGSFGRFVARVLPYRHLITEALLVNLVVGLLSLASPLLIQILTDDVLVRRDTHLLTTVAIGVIAVRVFSDILQMIQSHLIAHFAERFQLGLILEFGRQILRLPLNYYEARRSGEIVSRLRDIREINHLISQVAIKLPSRFFIALISLGLMLFYSWKLTLAALVVAAFMTLSTLIFLPTLQQKTRQVLVTSAENQGVLVETFKGALTLKTINAISQIWEEFQTRFGRLANVHLQTVQIGIFNRIFSRLVDGVGTIAILWFGSTLVIRQELTIGQLLAFHALSDNFTHLIKIFVEFVDEFARAQTATQRLSEVIDSTPEEQEEIFKPWTAISGSGDIICTNLNFYHVGRVDLLKDFSVTIPGGKVTALIGQSGCGKSTLAKLIARLYQAQSGNIRFGIYNQQDLALESLREQVVLVPQEPHFWSRSIIDNFRLSFPQVSFEKIVRACQITGADEFISQLPDKYQTVLGEFGANISGGQKQKLALARAIVNNPPVLILDESTNSLDPLSETQVLDRLFSSRKGKTTIIISHSPTVISRADWIIQIDRGQLQLTGDPQELRQLPGVHNQFLTNVEG
ncbi:MAG: peptidase domain-containing ABC transporter [Xenococcaceae cyanobacterium MO_188.B29]|nr:peptidase domain-containing ABC transporter [Xenococcaceae cyanobacterium MO_188.B29]